MAATIDTTGTTTTVTQTGARALISWDTFDIGQNATVLFEQGAGHVALNQILEQQGVTGADGGVQQRLGEPDHPLLVGVPYHQSAFAVLQDLLEGDDVADELVVGGLLEGPDGSHVKSPVLIHEPVPITVSMAWDMTGAAAAAVVRPEASAEDGGGALFCPARNAGAAGRGKK